MPSSGTRTQRLSWPKLSADPHSAHADRPPLPDFLAAGEGLAPGLALLGGPAGLFTAGAVCALFTGAGAAAGFAGGLGALTGGAATFLGGAAAGGASGAIVTPFFSLPSPHCWKRKMSTKYTIDSTGAIVTTMAETSSRSRDSMIVVYLGGMLASMKADVEADAESAISDTVLNAVVRVCKMGSMSRSVRIRPRVLGLVEAPTAANF